MTFTGRLLPGIPFIESPFFDVQLEAVGLSERERDIAVQLNRNGYAVIDFPDSRIHERIDGIKQRLEPKFEGLKTTAAAKLPHRRIQDAWRFDPDVKAIAANREILSLLGKLYGRPAFPFQTLNFPVGTQQALHTDAVHFSSIPERFMCGVWLAMEDIGPDAGPLCYVRSSHRWPVLNNAMIGRRGWKSTAKSAQSPFQESWNAIIEASGAQVESFHARKGQALIWCANLLHGGSRQTNDSVTRWSQVTHYYFENCIYYTPAFSDESLGRLALRDVVSVEDGMRRPNLYLGEQISPHSESKWGKLSKLVTASWRRLLNSGDMPSRF